MKGILGKFRNISANNHQEALRQIGGNFEVEKRDIYFKNNNNVEIMCPNHQVTVRKDTESQLGLVSRNYGVVQYDTSLSITTELVLRGEIDYVSGFVLGEGERLYLTMTDGESLVLDGLEIKHYFTLTNSHDGSVGFEIAPTFVNANTGSLLTFDGRRVWTKHSKHVDRRVEDLRYKLKKLKHFWSEFQDQASYFASISITAKDAMNFAEAMLPGDNERAANNRDKVVGKFLGGPLNAHASCKGTLLGAYLSFVDYCDQDKVVRNTGRMERDSLEVRAAFDGESSRQKAKAFGQMMELAKKLDI